MDRTGTLNIDRETEFKYSDDIYEFILKHASDFLDIKFTEDDTENTIIEKIENVETKEDDSRDKEAFLMVAAFFLNNYNELFAKFQGQINFTASHMDHTSTTFIENNYEMVLSGFDLFRENLKKSIFNNLAEYKKAKEINDKLDEPKEISKLEYLNNSKKEAKEKVKNKTKFWATDQTGRFVNDVTKELFKQNNIQYYIWETMRDDKVRPTHAELQGKLRKFGEGIEPGQEYNCRCGVRIPSKKELNKGG